MTDERVALTTGANSGIGLASVLELARRGLRSVGTVRSRSKVGAVAEAADAMGVTVETAILDVTDAQACERVVRKYRPTVIVNNAGFPVTGAIEDIGDDEVRAALETMVVGPMRLARLALPHMRTIHDGRIINVSSIYGRATTPLTGWYQASKHALEGASDALRAEVAGDGIKVVLVEPGFVRTGIWAEVDNELTGRGTSGFASSYRRLLANTRIASPIMSDPSKVAEVIAHAVVSRNPRARYLVGCDALAIAGLRACVPTNVWDRVARTVLDL
ncbi:MAG: SDR family NAD(P)-dependent oxidoreductase [Acidimicrobiales bacterium]|jgi:NAD(P)-dependent dehydrogenase (short-subunit alcohol dehydrogenase family)